jgi:hypothetical protein
MSSSLEKAIQGVLVTSGAATEAAAVAKEKQARKALFHTMRWVNNTAMTTTVAQAATPIGSIPTPMRLVEAKLLPGAAVTAASDHYLTMNIAARLAATPFTSRNLIAFVMDTVTDDDLVAFDEKDLMSYATATKADLLVAEGEIITAAVTKTGTNGLTYPVGTVELRFALRDA